MKAYIHIGIEQTGAITIQDFLLKNRQMLKKYFYIPGVFLIPSHILAVLALEYKNLGKLKSIYKINDEKQLKFQKKIWMKNIKAEVAGEKPVIFSSEFLQSHLTNIKEIQNLKNVLNEIGFNEIKIIIYIREQKSLLNSLYSEALKRGEIDENFDFTKKDCLKNISYFKHILDHKSTLKQWGEVFGNENIIANILDEKYLKNGNLIDDFLDIFKIRNEGFLKTDKEYKTLDIYGANFLKNLYQDASNIKEDEKKSFRKYILPFVEEYLCNSSQKPLIDEKILNDFYEFYKKDNEFISQNYFKNQKHFIPTELSNQNKLSNNKILPKNIFDFIYKTTTCQHNEILKLKNENNELKNEIIKNRIELAFNFYKKQKSIQEKNTQLKNNAKVGIIIPIYNVANYLDICIRSVLAQSYENIEILLINDGSTDNSLEIAKKYALMDKRIIVIDKPNSGLGNARNVGTRYFFGNYKFKKIADNNKLNVFFPAKNDKYNLKSAFSLKDGLDAFNITHFFFLDSDDFLEPEAILRCVEHSDNQDIVWISMIFYFDKILPNCKKTNFKFHNISQNQILNPKKWLEIVKNSDSHSFWFGGHGLICAKFLSKIKLEFIDDIIHEDEYYGKILFLKANSIFALNEPLYHYRIRPNSIMNYNNETTLDGLPQKIKLLMEYFESISEARYYLKLASLGITAAKIHIDFCEFIKEENPIFDDFVSIFYPNLIKHLNEFLEYNQDILGYKQECEEAAAQMKKIYKKVMGLHP